MGQAKLKKALVPSGGQSASIRSPIGARSIDPPHSNTGGTVGADQDARNSQSETRGRVSVSLTPELMNAVDAIAQDLGMNRAAVVLNGFMLGLEGMNKQAATVAALQRWAADRKAKL